MQRLELQQPDHLPLRHAEEAQLSKDVQMGGHHCQLLLKSHEKNMPPPPRPENEAKPIETLWFSAVFHVISLVKSSIPLVFLALPVPLSSPTLSRATAALRSSSKRLVSGPLQLEIHSPRGARLHVKYVLYTQFIIFLKVYILIRAAYMMLECSVYRLIHVRCGSASLSRITT